MESVVVNVHHFADMLEAHLRTRETPRIVISDERGELLGNRRRREEGAAAARRAIPSSPSTPIRSGSRDKQPEPEAPRGGLGPGADGHPDAGRAVIHKHRLRGPRRFHHGRGRPSAPPRNRRQRPFRLCGRRDREAGARSRHAGGRVLGQRLLRPRHRQGPPLRLAHSKGNGCMLASPRRLPRQKSASPPQAMRCEVRASEWLIDGRCLPRVFSIPPGCAFLPTLVDALLDGRLVGPLADDPAALADITIYVPNRRATRALIALLAERGDRQGAAPAAHRAPRRDRRGRVRADGARGHAAAGGREPQAPDPAARAPPHPHAPRAALVGASRPGAAAARPRRAVHGAGLSRRCGEPRGRSRDPDGRLHHGRHRLACPRTGGGFRLLDLFRDHAPLRADRERELAQDFGRAPGERPGAAPQRPAGGGSEAPHPRAARPVRSSSRARRARCRRPQTSWA